MTAPATQGRILVVGQGADDGDGALLVGEGQEVFAVLVTKLPDFNYNSNGSFRAWLRTVAKKDGDGYLLNGEKMWITNGGVASWYYVLATMDPSQGHKAMVAFMEQQNDGTRVFSRDPSD